MTIRNEKRVVNTARELINFLDREEIPSSIAFASLINSAIALAVTVLKLDEEEFRDALVEMAAVFNDLKENYHGPGADSP